MILSKRTAKGTNMSFTTLATIAADLIIDVLNTPIPTRTEVHGVYFCSVTGTYGVEFATYLGDPGTELGVTMQSLPMFNTEDEAYTAGAAAAAALNTLETDGVMPDWCSAGN
jgi:hypothetical protein